MVYSKMVLTKSKNSKSSLKVIPRPQSIEDMYSKQNFYTDVYNSPKVEITQISINDE